MKELFINKINNNEYISEYLFCNIEKQDKSLIPSNFNLDNYNEQILEKEYLKYKDYFDKMYQGIDENIHLDKEQIKAILADEDYSLIIAGAGTGKTTTMASKVKYLVDIKKVLPQNIAVMSYTKKATQELEQRINIDFGIPANVTTFHSLGMMHIREIFNNRKCYVVDNNLQNEIFLNYFKEKIFPKKEVVKELINIFSPELLGKNWIFGSFFKNNYERFKNFEEYFEEYKKYKIREIQTTKDLKTEIQDRIEKLMNQENIYTINGELVKSKGEARIANFLFCNNIEYQYEKIYEELMPEQRTYHPDFTLNLGEEEVYIEYFGLSTYDKDNLSRYNKIKKMKEDYHSKHNTKFIKLDYQPDQDLIQTLKEELVKMGFVLRPKSDLEIIDAILTQNQTSQFFPFQNFLYQVIETIKSSPKREKYRTIISDYLNQLPKVEYNMAIRQFYYIQDFYLYYQSNLFNVDDYGFDYSDMIYYAYQYIETIGNNNKLNFEYLIIDEYQDISNERYILTKKIADRNQAKVVAVGDDWQSIYSFSGSIVHYTYNFEQYFKGAKTFKITKTYRNSQSLIDYSGTFIMKNPAQIKKDLISDKEIKNPIRFVGFEFEEEYEVLKKLILHIHSQHPDHNIMILSRTNKMIEKCYEDPSFKDGVDTKIEFVGYEDIDIDGMSIHKSKGLTSDEVIVIGLNEKFPSPEHRLFWLESLFKMPPPKEPIPFAEERRVFYVALTRTKNYCYLLVNKDPNLRSPFINEMISIIQEKNQ